MFDLNQRYNRRYTQCYDRLIVAPIHITNMHITVYHTNGRSIRKMIGVVVNRLVGIRQ